MRGGRYIILLVGFLLLAGACGQPGRPGQDLLFLQTPGGVGVITAGAGVSAFEAPGAVASGNWSTVVSAEANGKSTRLVALNPASNDEMWETSLSGRLSVKVVSDDGSRVALSPTGERYYRYGRTKTKLIIAGNGVSTPRIVNLEGNFEPEAFSTDGQHLFVLQYRPARAPTSYQVRRLDLNTGKIHGVYTVDAELQGAMRGTARVQAMSPDGKRLYTLYTLGHGDDRHVFIHVLSLDELWAHCVDLTSEFGASPQSATALTPSANGKHLYVANAVTGAIAEVDTEALTVVRTAQVSFGLGTPVNAALGPSSTLYLTSGRRLAALDSDGLTEEMSRTMPGKITGIQVAADGHRLFVGQRNEIVILNSLTGGLLGRIDPPEISRIGRLGRAIPRLNQVRQNITCAC